MENILDHKLNAIWMGKILTGESMSVKDLYQFSRIKLKRKRIRKKFDKNYSRYISKEVEQVYMAILMAIPLTNTFRHMLDTNKIDLIEPMDGLPKGELFYLDPITK